MSVLYTHSHTDLEDNADFVKMVTINALVHDGYLTNEEGEEWCKHNTIILRKKSIFRTISDLWKKTKESKDSLHYLVVSRNRSIKEIGDNACGIITN
jgi:hypothetical protein